MLTGHVHRAEDVALYRAALGGTPLVVCRLASDRAALRDPIMARTRGDGPPLAGDRRAGLPADEVDAVLDLALTEQARLDQTGIGELVLDTSDLDIGEPSTDSARCSEWFPTTIPRTAENRVSPGVRSSRQRRLETRT